MIKAICLRPNDWFMRLTSPEIEIARSNKPTSVLDSTAGDYDPRLVKLFTASAAVACLGVILAGTLITLGWAFDCDVLKDPLSFGGKVPSSVALTFILSALALAGKSFGRTSSLARRLANLLGLAVAAIGALTLIENLSGLDLHLNQIWWQVRDDGPGIMFPGPMAPGVSICFILFGLSSLLFGIKTRQGVYPAQFFSMATALICLVALLGYACGVSYLCTIAGCIKVPLAAALLFLVLCYANLFGATDQGLMGEFVKCNRAGTLVRRASLLIASLPLPLWLKTTGEHAGLYDQAFGWALFSLCALALVVCTLVWTASAFDRLDSQVQKSDREVARCKEIECMKQEFVAEVSHELRTPLTSLQATLTLLSEGVYGQLSDSGERRVKSAESGISRLINLINNLLDIEKMEAGKLRLRYADINLGDVVQQSVDVVQGFAEQYGVTLVVQKPNQKVLADSERMVQVLVNLLSNAIKFSEPDDTVEIAFLDRADCSEVQVIDHGTGIPAGCEESIFAKYEQAHTPDVIRRRGTGLGLPICKAIVEQHGGTVGVRPTDGGGSTFWFSMPNSSASQQAL